MHFVINMAGVAYHKRLCSLLVLAFVLWTWIPGQTEDLSYLSSKYVGGKLDLTS